MIDKTAALQAVSNLLTKLRSEESTLRREYDERLAELSAKIVAVETTLLLLDNSAIELEASIAVAAVPTEPATPGQWDPASATGALAPLPGERPSLRMLAQPTAQPSIEAKSAGEWSRLLRNCTQHDALQRIAEENGGILRISEAKRILMAAKLVRGNPKNVNSHLYHMVATSDAFERIAPGTFRLVSRQQTFERLQ